MAETTEKTPAELIAEAQSNHPTMKWYDKFEASIKRREYRTIAGGTAVQILGWELGKKEHPVFIEPEIADQFNSFALGIEKGGVGHLYVPKGKHKNGDFYKYLDPNYRPQFDLDK